MSEDHIRKTRARAAERERRQARQARNEKLMWQIPLAAGAVLALVAVAYFVFTSFGQAAPAAGPGTSAAHFQVDTAKLDLGDQPLGKTVQAAFNVKNTGDGALTLNAAQIATLLEGC